MDQDQIATELAVAQTMSDELDDYLMDNSLYRQMVARTPHGTQPIVMTLGSLLEHVASLQQVQGSLSPGQRSQLEAIAQKVDHARHVFSGQWRAHIQRELHGAVDSWKWYLEDAANSARARDNYASEVHQRSRIELLMNELGNAPDAGQERGRLDPLDQRLRGMLHGDSYNGPRGTESDNPSDRAWWLYGRPTGEND